MLDFSGLKVGDVIHNNSDGDMKVIMYNYFGDGEEMCFTDENNIYPASEFSACDWELKGGEDVKFVFATGGREKYFKQPRVGDCVCRAICNATGLDYMLVYDLINEGAKTEKTGKRKRKVSSARNGVFNTSIKYVMNKIGGWKWHATMTIGSGCHTHLRKEDLPSGTLIVSLSKHYTCVKDGVIYDTYDCSRDGTRCVYGYWSKE